MRRVTKSIELSYDIWTAAAQQAEHDDVGLTEYLTWLITRDTITLGKHRRDDHLQRVNNTIQALLDENTLTEEDEATALHTLDLVEELLGRIGGEDLKACLHLPAAKEPGQDNGSPTSPPIAHRLR